MKHVDLYIVTSIHGLKTGRGRYLYSLHMTRENGEEYEKDNRETMVWQRDTNRNILTLCALEEALLRIRQPCSLHIWLDCFYVSAVLQNGWLKMWKQNGWITAKGCPVKNAVQWESVDEKLKMHEITLHLKEEYPNREKMEWYVCKYANKDTFLLDNKMPLSLGK